MKITSFIIHLGLLLFSVVGTRAQQDISNTASLYDSIAWDFCEQYFTNNTGQVNDSLQQLKEELLREAPIQYVQALFNYSVRMPLKDYKTMLLLIDELMLVFSHNTHPREYAKLLLLKGKAYLNSGYYYVEAYHHINEAIGMLERDKDAAYIGFAYSQLGALWRNLQEFDHALEYCKKSEEMYRSIGYETDTYNMRLNECIIYLETESKEKIIEIIREDLPWAEAQKNTVHIEFLNVILGSYYILMNDLDSAYLFFNRALQLKTNSGRQSYILSNIGEVFFLKNEYEESRNYLEKALPFTHETNRLLVESKVCQMLATIYYKEGNLHRAYEHLQKATHLKDSLALQEKANEIHRRQAKTTLMYYQQELQITKQQAEINRTRFYLVALLFLFVVAIFFFVLFYLNRKRKMKEMENTQLAQQLQLEELEHQQQIEEKEREMATTQLLIAEKSKVLEHMLEIFKPFHESGELPKSMWKEMKTFAASNTHKENEWEKSKVHFEKVHPDFFKRLKELAPDLTENELRVCAYIRIGMTTKQIAEILSVTQRSVISSRYRIKKKTRLEEKESLEGFIRNI